MYFYQSNAAFVKIRDFQKHWNWAETNRRVFSTRNSVCTLYHVIMMFLKDEFLPQYNKQIICKLFALILSFLKKIWPLKLMFDGLTVLYHLSSLFFGDSVNWKDSLSPL